MSAVHGQFQILAALARPDVDARWVNTGAAWALKFESELLEVGGQLEVRGEVVRRERWLD